MPPGTPPFRLRTLGRPDLLGPDGNPLRSVLSQPKRLTLLIYLCTAASGDFVRRERLLALFWPESDEERARNALSQALHRLRRSLGEAAVVVRGSDELGVDTGRLWCDAVAFGELLSSGRDEEALDLYRGDFLDGISVDGGAPELEHWMDGERARLRNAAAAAAERLVTAEERRGNLAGAARWAWRASELRTTDEGALERLIGLLEKQGDRTGATRAYADFARRLREEYGLELSEQLRARGDALLARAPAPPAPSIALSEPAEADVRRDGTHRTRLIVLPFRMLRPDEETEFLTFSLPDAVTASMAGLRSLVVRSNLAAQRFAGGVLDLQAIADQAEVDVILTGSLLRVGEQLRVSCQLTDAGDGTLIWSQTSQVMMGNLFELQDQLTRRIVDSLALPLSAGERDSLGNDAPGNAEAYALYLRANQLAHSADRWLEARDLYLACLERDPDYAPAWARLGRCERLIAKFSSPRDAAHDGFARAEEAFRRALQLNPELPVAHSLYAQLEVDLGRAPDAMVRLLLRARAQGGDPALFAALVHACRFCGLLEASLAADWHARRLDPAVDTSVAHTYWMLGDCERALEHTRGDIGYMPGLALAGLGRHDESVQVLSRREREVGDSRIRDYVQSLRALLQDERAESLAALNVAAADLRDGEALFYLARCFAWWGERERAIQELERVLDGGFFCVAVLRRDPWLDPLRSDPRFEALLRRAEQLQRRAAEDFRSAGGAALLPAPTPHLGG